MPRRPDHLAGLAGLAALATAVAAGPAPGGDLTLDGSAFERVEADSNLRLREEGDGGVVGTSTGIDLDLGYDARRTVWALGAGARFRALAGPGDDDTLEGFADPRLSGAVERTGRRQSFEATFDLRRRPVALTLIDETVERAREEEGKEARLEGTAGWTLRAAPGTTFTLDGEAALRRFSEETDALVPSDALTLRGGWTRALTPRTEAGLGLTGRSVTAEGSGEDADSIIVLIDGVLTMRPTARHAIDLALGVGHRWTERSAGEGVSGIEDTDAGPVVGGEAALVWQGTPESHLRLGAAHALEPSAGGELAHVTRLSATLARRMTRRSRLVVAASLARRSVLDVFRAAEEDDESLLYRLHSRIDTRLTRAWQLGGGATLRLRSGDGDDAASANVFLELRRDFVLLR